MLRVGFELTIPVFERAKTVHASDRAATLIGKFQYCSCKIFSKKMSLEPTSLSFFDFRVKINIPSLSHDQVLLPPIRDIQQAAVLICGFISHLELK
jgi:hypothetical protein